MYEKRGRNHLPLSLEVQAVPDPVVGEEMPDLILPQDTDDLVMIFVPVSPEKARLPEVEVP